VADVSLEVVNDSGMALMGLHASPPGEEAWGRDLMRVHVLPDGETGHYVVEADAGQCEFDLRAVLEDGSRRYGVVDVCALPIRRIEGAR
jgi:hypothetical protein